MPGEFLSAPDQAEFRNPFRTKRTAALALAGLLLIACASLVMMIQENSQRFLPRREPIPPFTVVDRNGSTVESSAFCQARSIFLFYKPECPHCKVLFRELNTIRGTGGSGMNIRFISVGPIPDRGQIPELGKDTALYSIDPRIARQVLKIASVPVMMIVDERGVLRDEIVGERPATVLARAIVRGFGSGREG